MAKNERRTGFRIVPLSGVTPGPLSDLDSSIPYKSPVLFVDWRATFLTKNGKRLGSVVLSEKKGKEPSFGLAFRLLQDSEKILLTDKIEFDRVHG